MSSIWHENQLVLGIFHGSLIALGCLVDFLQSMDSIRAVDHLDHPAGLVSAAFQASKCEIKLYFVGYLSKTLQYERASALKKKTLDIIVSLEMGFSGKLDVQHSKQYSTYLLVLLRFAI